MVTEASYAGCSRGSQLEQYVTTSLVQLLCRTTKLCWFDDDHFRTIVDDAKTLLAKGSSGLPVCLQALTPDIVTSHQLDADISPM